MSDAALVERVKELEKAVADAHKMSVALQVRYFGVAARKVTGFTVYSALNSLTWRLGSVLRKGETAE